MPELSSSKIIEQLLHANNNKFKSGIGYDMITGRDLMVQLGPIFDFKRQSLQWYVATVPMNQPSGMIGESDLSKREMRKVIMQTA